MAHQRFPLAAGGPLAGSCELSAYRSLSYVTVLFQLQGLGQFSPLLQPQFSHCLAPPNAVKPSPQPRLKGKSSLPAISSLVLPSLERVPPGFLPLESARELWVSDGLPPQSAFALLSPRVVIGPEMSGMRSVLHLPRISSETAGLLLLSLMFHIFSEFFKCIILFPIAFYNVSI